MGGIQDERSPLKCFMYIEQQSIKVDLCMDFAMSTQKYTANTVAADVSFSDMHQIQNGALGQFSFVFILQVGPEVK